MPHSTTTNDKAREPNFFLKKEPIIMVKSLIRIAFIFVLASIACSLPISAATVEPTPKAVSQLLVTADPNSTATPTPFQPIGPTATSAFTATPQATSTPDPNDDGLGNIGLPTPVRIDQPLPKDTLNLLLLGSDYRPNAGYRTDVIMLVSINPVKGTVSVVSFPRDLYVFIPGWMTQRINTAQPRGGFSMMADTFEYNFGVRPTHYVMTNFQGFIGIINSLGGINVNVGSYLSDSCDLPQAVGGYCTVSPGSVRMDGATALWYVRSRHSSSDFDRTRRAQEVIYGVFAKMMSLDAVSRLPELYTSYKSSVETNIGLEQIVPLVPLASQVLADSSRIRRFTIGPGQVTPTITESGAAVLIPNYDAIQAILRDALFGP
jgi:LCP family protein required for cell wall assembly